MSIGKILESLSRRILAGMILVGRLGVPSTSSRRRDAAEVQKVKPSKIESRPRCDTEVQPQTHDPRVPVGVPSLFLNV